MRVLIRGAGDIATGIALRLYRSHMQVVMTDLPAPTAIRRTVCFSQAIVLGRTEVEGVAAVLAADAAEAESLLAQEVVPVLADPDCRCRQALRPDAEVDAILAKRNLGTAITDAPVVIGIGPGFTAGADCHAVVETMRGHTLGRVIYEGSALPNTNIPGLIGGYAGERVLRAPADGIFHQLLDIGRRRGRRGERPAHAMYHRRRGAGSPAGGYAGASGHESRRCGPAMQAGILHHGVGQGAGRGRRRAGGDSEPKRRSAR